MNMQIVVKARKHSIKMNNLLKSIPLTCQVQSRKSVNKGDSCP